MKTKISFVVENNVLMCFLTGERSSVEIANHWKLMIEKCESENIKKILMNLALVGKFDPFEAIKNYQSVIELLKNQPLKVAITDMSLISSPDTQVACNMGASQGINVEYFDCKEDAINWLLVEQNEMNMMA